MLNSIPYNLPSLPVAITPKLKTKEQIAKARYHSNKTRSNGPAIIADQEKAREILTILHQ